MDFKEEMDYLVHLARRHEFSMHRFVTYLDAHTVAHSNGTVLSIYRRMPLLVNRFVYKTGAVPRPIHIGGHMGGLRLKGGDG